MCQHSGRRPSSPSPPWWPSSASAPKPASLKPLWSNGSTLSQAASASGCATTSTSRAPPLGSLAVRNGASTGRSASARSRPSSNAGACASNSATYRRAVPSWAASSSPVIAGTSVCPFALSDQCPCVGPPRGASTRLRPAPIGKRSRPRPQRPGRRR